MNYSINFISQIGPSRFSRFMAGCMCEDENSLYKTIEDNEVERLMVTKSLPIHDARTEARFFVEHRKEVDEKYLEKDQNGEEAVGPEFTITQNGDIQFPEFGSTLSQMYEDQKKLYPQYYNEEEHHTVLAAYKALIHGSNQSAHLVHHFNEQGELDVRDAVVLTYDHEANRGRMHILNISQQGKNHSSFEKATEVLSTRLVGFAESQISSDVHIFVRNEQSIDPLLLFKEAKHNPGEKFENEVTRVYNEPLIEEQKNGLNDVYPAWVTNRTMMFADSQKPLLPYRVPEYLERLVEVKERVYSTNPEKPMLQDSHIPKKHIQAVPRQQQESNIKQPNTQKQPYPHSLSYDHVPHTPAAQEMAAKKGRVQEHGFLTRMKPKDHMQELGIYGGEVRRQEYRGGQKRKDQRKSEKPLVSKEKNPKEIVQVIIKEWSAKQEAKRVFKHLLVVTAATGIFIPAGTPLLSRLESPMKALTKKEKKAIRHEHKKDRTIRRMDQKRDTVLTPKSVNSKEKTKKTTTQRVLSKSENISQNVVQTGKKNQALYNNEFRRVRIIGKDIGKEKQKQKQPLKQRVVEFIRQEKRTRNSKEHSKLDKRKERIRPIDQVMLTVFRTLVSREKKQRIRVEGAAIRFNKLKRKEEIKGRIPPDTGGYSKEKKRNIKRIEVSTKESILRFTQVLILIMLLSSKQVQHVVERDGMQKEDKNKNMPKETELSSFPWVLFSIVYYLTAIREQGKSTNMTKKKKAKKAKKTKGLTQVRTGQLTGIIFNYQKHSML